MIKAISLDYYGVLAKQVSGGWQLNYQLIHLLQNLKRRYKTALISNSYAKTIAELNPQLDAGLFDIVMIGGATGLWKPDTIVYETLVQKLALAPAEILAVDDNESHLAAAAAVGLRTHLYKNLDDFQKRLSANID